MTMKRKSRRLPVHRQQRKADSQALLFAMACLASAAHKLDAEDNNEHPCCDSRQFATYHGATRVALIVCTHWGQRASQRRCLMGEEGSILAFCTLGLSQLRISAAKRDHDEGSSLGKTANATSQPNRERASHEIYLLDQSENAAGFDGSASNASCRRQGWPSGWRFRAGSSPCSQ